MGRCVYETFQGTVEAAGGKTEGWEGGGGSKAAATAAYISQCTQRTGHLIYIEPHWLLMQCGVRCGSRERSPTIRSAGVMAGGEYGLAASPPLAAHAETLRGTCVFKGHLVLNEDPRRRCPVAAPSLRWHHCYLQHGPHCCIYHPVCSAAFLLGLQAVTQSQITSLSFFFLFHLIK